MKIGILTSGGDCPGINATIRGVCKTAINHYGMEVFGIRSGFRGLLDNDIEPLTEKSLSGLLNLGGTILGTSREKPFKKRLSAASEDKPALMLKNIHELGLDCIVCIGGNGTQKTAAKLAQAGVNVVSVPKTIDNDVCGGFLEMKDNKCTVLATIAEADADIDTARAAAAKERAEQRLASKSEDIDTVRAENALKRAVARLRTTHKL